MVIKKRIHILLLILLIVAAGCRKAPEASSRKLASRYLTEKVVILVIDGPRFSETWGDPERKYVPHLAQDLQPRGCFNRQFYNFGRTKTIPGHTAIITGVYEDLDNNGRQYPSYPSLFQHWLKLNDEAPEKAWIITSKEKLAVVGNTSQLEWRNHYGPRVDAATRLDDETYQRVISVMDTHAPDLLFINFREPDWYAHRSDWTGYLDAIRKTDSLSWELWQYLQNDPDYQGKTTFILSNDHGRHLDGIADGFKTHGDQCVGCTHISLFASGPDFKQGQLLSVKREQIDIAPTLARLLGLKLEQTDGQVMTELFINP